MLIDEYSVLFYNEIRASSFFYNGDVEGGKMYYLIVALWLVACLSSCQLRKVQQKHLTRSCPCVAAAGFIIAAALYLMNQFIAAIIVLIVAGYITVTLLWTIFQQNRMTEKGTF